MASVLFLSPLIILVLVFIGLPLWLFIDRIYSSENLNLNTLHSLNYDLLLDQLRYTFLQGVVSAFLSTVLALLLAYFFAGYRWPGRRLFFALSSIPFALPGVVVASGFIIVYGRSGHIGQWLGDDRLLLYNFGAVTAAHVFFNFPYIFKRIVIAMEALPSEFYKTSEILGIKPGTQFRIWIWPEIKNLVASLFLSTCILCFSSFAIVLILGGNPRQSTLEVAIYDMLQSEGDWWGAGALSLLQILLILPFIGMLRFYTKKSSDRLGMKGISGASQNNKRISENTLGFRLMAVVLILTLTFFLLAPILGVLYEGLSLEFSAIPKEIYFRILEAFKNSFLLAAAVSIVGVFVAWLTARGLCLCKARSLKLFDFLDGLLWVLMALSPAVLSMAWLHLTSNLDTNLEGVIFWVIVMIQVVLCLPFLIRIILPSIQTLELRIGRTAESLALGHFKKMIWLEWPELKRVLLAGAALGCSFSLGEVVSLLIFGQGRLTTIASLIFEFMGAYKFALGAMMATILMLICAALTYVSERWLSGNEVDHG